MRRELAFERQIEAVRAEELKSLLRYQVSQAVLVQKTYSRAIQPVWLWTTHWLTRARCPPAAGDAHGDSVGRHPDHHLNHRILRLRRRRYHAVLPFP